MKIALMGGSSMLSTYLIDKLLNSDIEVKCLVKSKLKALSLPYEVSCILGSPDNYASLEALFDDAQVALIHLSPSYNEARYGINALYAAQKAGVKKIVYISSMMPWNSRHLPLFRNKVRIEEVLRGLTLPYTILRPNFFFQNLLNFETEIMEKGIYPFPIGHHGVSQVDLRDVAEAAFNALTLADHDWKEYSICGPEVLSCDDVSAILSDVMGRKIVSCANDMRIWKSVTEKFMPKAMVEEWTEIFGFFRREGMFPDEDDMVKQKDIISGEPLSFRDFAEELAFIWKTREQNRLNMKVNHNKLYRGAKREANSGVYHHHHV